MLKSNLENEPYVKMLVCEQIEEETFVEFAFQHCFVKNTSCNLRPIKPIFNGFSYLYEVLSPS